jgi:MFS family permease
MIGNGLQGTLLGVRATIEGFDTATIGFIMSLYYLGYLGGSYYVPKLVSRVGHIRVFTALASLASATVLLHGLYPDPWLWAGIRSLTGFSYAGLYIVVESWLNNTSTKKTRGKIFGIYQVISYGGMVIGQFLLNLSDPSTINLFVMTSILVSIALIPISLSSRPAPDFDEPDHLPLKRLFKVSPLGLAGCFGTGVGGGALFGLGAVYASEIGMTIPQISTFMALFIFGGVATQIPIGWLSDRYDRRIVLIAISFLSAIASILCFVTSGHPLSLNFAMFILGCLSLPIYGLAMAHITDHLTPKQYVAGSSSAILINGLGAAIGPLIISLFMEMTHINSFFILIAGVFMTLCVYGLYRTQQSDAVPLEDQGDHVSMPLRPSPISMTITEEGHEIMKEMEKNN